jgi:hypothetical protein
MFSAAFLEFPDGLILDFIGITDILMISYVSILTIINSVILFYECKSNIPRSKNPTKSDGIPVCGPTFGSLVLAS